MILPANEQRLYIVGVCIVERIRESRPDPAVDLRLIEPENSRQPGAHITKRPFATAPIAKDDFAFAAIVIPSGKDVVPAMPPPHESLLANRTGTENTGVANECIEGDNCA
jgi:hypothetical protein